jgi:protein-disulfide isomerase
LRQCLPAEYHDAKMSITRRILWFVPLLLFLCLPGEQAAKAEVLGSVGERTIDGSEIEQSLRIPLYELEMEKYRLVNRRLQQTIGEELLARAARAAGKSVSEYVTQQIQQQAGTVSDEEINIRYQEARRGVSGSGPNGEDEQRGKEEMKNSILRERAAHALRALLARLATEANVSILLQPPEAPVIQLSEGNDPSMGLPTAPVTIVEYGDFECLICKESVPILQQLLKLYPEQVRLVYRDFPLASHPQAWPAAEAAQCADEQGQFWAYHDALFAQAPDLNAGTYPKLAEQVHLDAEQFATCLKSGHGKAAVAKDQAEGHRLGLSGTPTFFVNGRYMGGFQSLDRLREAVEGTLRDVQQKLRARKPEDVRP